jgi:hypothetical protein
MTLVTVWLHAGVAQLGQWGYLQLTGRYAAVIRASMSEDIEVPTGPAESLPSQTMILAERPGRLLFLPFSADTVACLDMSQERLAYPILSVPRDEDEDMRVSSIRIIEGVGVLYLTERCLLLFDEKLELVWQVVGDFLPWAFEDIVGERIVLAAEDPLGRVDYETRSLADGNVIPAP